MHHDFGNHWLHGGQPLVGPGKPKLEQHGRVAGRARIHEGMTLPGCSLTDLGGYGPVVVAGVRSGPGQTSRTPVVGFQAHHWVAGGLARPNPSQPGGRLSGPPLGCGVFGQAKPFATWWSAFRPTTGLRSVWPGQTLRNLVVGFSSPPLGCGVFGQAKPFATWWSAFRPTTGL